MSAAILFFKMKKTTALDSDGELISSPKKEELNVSSSVVSPSCSSLSESKEGAEAQLERIIASKNETFETWSKILDNVNTAEIQRGSRWFQPCYNAESSDKNTFQERYLIKWAGLSYMHCSWETEDDLLEEVVNAKRYLTTFFRKSFQGLFFTPDERGDGEYRVDSMFRKMSHVSTGLYTEPFLGLGTSKNDGISHCLYRLARAATEDKSIRMLFSSSENNVLFISHKMWATSTFSLLSCFVFRTCASSILLASGLTFTKCFLVKTLECFIPSETLLKSLTTFCRSGSASIFLIDLFNVSTKVNLFLLSFINANVEMIFLSSLVVMLSMITLMLLAWCLNNISRLGF